MNYKGKYSLKRTLVAGTKHYPNLNESGQKRLKTGPMAEKLAQSLLSKGTSMSATHVPAGSPDLTVPSGFGAAPGNYEVKSVDPGFKYASPITLDCPGGATIQATAKSGTKTSIGGWSSSAVQGGVAKAAAEANKTLDAQVQDIVDWYCGRDGKKGIIGVTNCEQMWDHLTANGIEPKRATIAQMVDAAQEVGAEVAIWTEAELAGKSAKTSCQSYGAQSAKISSKGKNTTAVPVEMPKAKDAGAGAPVGDEYGY